MRRGYVDTRVGQVHFRRQGDGERVIVALPPVPYGSRYFEPLAQYLGDAPVTLLCPDPPGYGESAGFDRQPSIGDFAEVMAEVIAAGDPTTVEVLGFHSGALVAMTLAARGLAPVARLHLIDVPAFDEVERAAFSNRQSPQRETPVELSDLEKIWDFNVSRHKQKITADRGVGLFVDDLISGAAQPRGFIAAFACDALAMAAEIACPVRLVGTQGGLLAPTRELRARFENAGADLSYDEWLKVQGLVFDVHAERVARWLLS